jgi:hypothetical protein
MKPHGAAPRKKARSSAVMLVPDNPVMNACTVIGAD